MNWYKVTIYYNVVNINPTNIDNSEARRGHMHTKVGFVEVSCTPHVDGMDGRGRPMRRADLAEEAMKYLKNEGYEVISFTDADQCVHTVNGAWKAWKELAYAEVDCVVIYCASWIWATYYLQAIRRWNIPSVIWTPASPQGWNLNSLAVLGGSFRQWEIPFSAVIGRPSDSKTRAELKSGISACRVKTRLAKSKFGCFGGTSMGIATGFADFNEWARKFGIWTEFMSEALIIERARNSIQKNEVNACYQELKKTGCIVPEMDDPLEKSIRHYLAYRSIIEEFGFDFASIKDTFEAGDIYIAASFTHAMNAADGFVSTGEGECYAALTEYVFHLITDEPFMMGDLQHVDWEENIMVMVESGGASYKCASSPEKVRFSPQWSGEQRAGGYCNSFVCKPGKITVGRLTKVGNGEHEFLISRGDCLEMGEDYEDHCGCGMKDWPHAFFTLEGDARAFVDHMNVEYIHIVYGDIVDELIETCKHLGINAGVVL
jgi:L-fucose isomerase-like protein